MHEYVLLLCVCVEGVERVEGLGGCRGGGVGRGIGRV